jgi:hypothetical protein
MARSIYYQTLKKSPLTKKDVIYGMRMSFEVGDARVSQIIFGLKRVPTFLPVNKGGRMS